MNTETGYLILSLAGILSTVLVFLIKSCFQSKCFKEMIIYDNI